MHQKSRLRLAAGVAAAALVATGGIVATTLPAAAAPAPALDYLGDSLQLDAGHVFEPVTHERFESLLNASGTYAFLVGGPADATTRAAAQHIDAVAQQYGVDAIYTFDPRLDGDKIDIRSFGTGDLGTQVRGLYTDLVTELNKDTTPQFGTGSDPYLFIYDKDRKVGEAEDRIVASLGGTISGELSGDAATAYRAQVAGVFDAVAVEGRADLDTRTQFEFFRDGVNGKHAAQYEGREQYGSADIFTAADAEGFRLQSITYPELIALLEADTKSTILFGGTWCHNTRAVIKDVNRAARESDTEVVYVFDLRLDGASGNNLHIRDTKSSLAYLYGDVVAKYLTNLRTEYTLTGSRVDYFPGGDTTKPLAQAQKLQVPYLIEYDKGREGGNTAPIAKDWIRELAGGAYKEYMTEWWWVTHVAAPARTGETEEARLARQTDAWAFADEAIAKIDGFFGLASAPERPVAPTVAVDGSSLTATWAAPANGGSAITAYRVSLNGGEPIQVGATVTSHTFAEIPAGTYKVTVTAVNYLGDSPVSQPSAAVTVVAPTTGPQPTQSPSPTQTQGPLPETGGDIPSLSVKGTLSPGGSITVSGSGYAASQPVRVELHSTPVVLGTTATTAGGAFSLTATVPSSTPPGAHSIVVFVNGVEVSRTAITISGSLAATGASSAPVLGLGVGAAVLALGVLATLIVLRRRQEA